MNKNHKITSAAIVALSATMLIGVSSTVPTEASSSALAGAVASMYSVSEYVIDSSTPLSGTTLAISNILTMVQNDVGARLIESTALSDEELVDEEDERPGEFDKVGIANVTDYVNIRTAPSEDAELAGKLYAKGAAVVLDIEGDWAHIRSGKVEGYIHSDYLIIGDEDLCIANSSIVARVKVDALNIRTSPDNSDNDNIMSSASMGDGIVITDLTVDGYPDWIQVLVGNKKGYVAREYVSCSREYASVAESREDELKRIAAEKAEEERQKKAAEEAARRKSQSKSNKSQSGQSSSSSARSYTPPTGSDGAAVANFGLQFVGNPYVYGGTSLTNGTDCSGFVMSVYANFGVGLPHSSSSLRSVGYGVSADEMQAGDIVCYSGHVGICIGNGQIVHASNRRDGIKVSSAYYRNILAVRRIF